MMTKVLYLRTNRMYLGYVFCMFFMVPVYGMKQEIGELERVITDVQKSGAVPQVIGDLKDIYNHVVPLIHSIQKDRAMQPEPKSGAVTPQDAASHLAIPVHVASAQTTSTSVMTTETKASTTISGGQPFVVGSSTTPLTGAPGVSDNDKGKEKEATIHPVAAAVSSERYTEDDMWTMLQLVNPVVYQFGKDHRISAHDLLVYAHLLQQYQLEPAAIVQFIKNHNGLDEAKPNGWAVDAYTEIQKNDPDRYQMLMLAVMKEIFDKANGDQTPSLLNSTHIDFLHEKVADQQSALQWRTGGLGATVLGWVGTLVWAAYTQYMQSHAGSVPLNGTFTG